MNDTGRYNFTAFTAQVVERCRALWPDADISAHGYTVTVVRPNPGEGEWQRVELRISRAYREYWSTGDLQEVLAKLFAAVSTPPISSALIERQAMLKFDHRKLVEEGPARLYWPVDANPDGVVITAVLDFPGNMLYLDESGEPTVLEKHGFTHQQFWDIGMRHLRDLVKTFKPQHLEFTEAWPGHEIWVVANGSGYASAALLCPDIVDSWMPSALQGYGWIAGIPDRDTLIITRPDTPPELLASAMANGRATGLYPFDWTIYTVEAGALVNFWGTMEDAMRQRATELGFIPPTPPKRKRP